MYRIRSSSPDYESPLYQTLTLHGELGSFKFEDYPANRQLIKDNTLAIDLNLAKIGTDVTRSFVRYAEDEPEVKQAKINRNKESLKLIEEIFKSVTPESIYDVRWKLGLDSPFDLFDPKPSGYAIHARNLLQAVSTFTNLTTFQYVSCDVSSRFEDEISKTVEMLPKLETLVLVRLSADAKKWDEYDAFDEGKEDEMSKLIGQRLGSLTKLKRLHLQGLVAPRASWSELEWKSPLLYLKVNTCTWLYGLAVFPFAYAFRKTLLGISIGAEQVRNQKVFDPPKLDFSKGFEVLEELQVLSDLRLSDFITRETRRDWPDRGEGTFLDDICQAPKLKHLDIYFDYSKHLLPHIKTKIENHEPVWPSLKSLVATDDNSYKEAKFVPFTDQEMNIVREKKVSFEFGLLHASWQTEDKRLRGRHRYGKYAKMTLPNGRFISVKARQLVENGDTEVSLELRPINL